jgi:hypothetical protein
VQSVEEHQVREVLKCVIHTIIFNRALGHVTPRDVDLQLINVSYVEVDDEHIERQVDKSLKEVEEVLVARKARLAHSSRADASSVRALPCRAVPGACCASLLE